MANGKGPILNLQGKVDSSNALVVVNDGSGSTSSPTAPIANLVGAVNASNQLRVRFL